MRCQFCGHHEQKVVDSREAEDTVRRRRECLKCGKRFTTYERVETSALIVVKKDGRREEFSREKLKGGMRKACEKRPISEEAIEQSVQEIEAELRARPSAEIPSTVIGNLVMKHLRKLDKVAYIRFASVYREFADITTFQEELQKLAKK
ncbi:transcriptional regulator NrdR [Candidatus Woesearchaeota archaeon]|nr:transcriptional regulator NrdR [Candidatus Woesearchaeota archaeon]